MTVCHNCGEEFELKDVGKALIDVMEKKIKKTKNKEVKK